MCPFIDVPLDQNCFVGGWGTLESDGDSPDALNSVDVTIYDDSVCANSDSYGGEFIPDLEVCAGKYEGGKDACQGELKIEELMSTSMSVITTSC